MDIATAIKIIDAHGLSYVANGGDGITVTIYAGPRGTTAVDIALAECEDGLEYYERAARIGYGDSGVVDCDAELRQLLRVD